MVSQKKAYVKADGFEASAFAQAETRGKGKKQDGRHTWHGGHWQSPIWATARVIALTGSGTAKGATGTATWTACSGTACAGAGAAGGGAAGARLTRRAATSA
jgi:hypothetical protein